MKVIEITINDNTEQARVDDFVESITTIADFMNITAVIVYNETEDEQA